MIRKRLMKSAAVVGLLAVGGLALGATAAQAEESVPKPDKFTSAFTAMVTPDMVVNAENVATPGTAGAWGTFNYMINSDLEIICYNLSVEGIKPPYKSPAKTATHIHQGEVGKAGPPRIAFPNPVEVSPGKFVSEGCLKGPFTTGVKNKETGKDTGEGFSLKAIEANPAAFFTDTHTEANPAGAVRGQLKAVPVGGVDTGFGGAAESDSGVATPLALGGVGLAGAAGIALWLRRRAQV